MKSGWKTAKFKDVSIVVGGSTPKTDIPEYWGGDNYWVAPAELDGGKYISSTVKRITDLAVSKTNLALLPCGTVLLSSRAPIGKVAITTVPMYCNQGFKNIVCGPELFNGFVYYFLKHNVTYLQSLGTGATFKEISKKVVENVSISFPPIEEQQRIVAELDLLTGIIEKKNAQLRDLDALAQSIFYEMFGDPGHSIYPVVPLSSLSKSKLSYGSGASAINFNGDIRYIRITDIQDNGTLSSEPMSPSVYDDKYLLKEGDILFARSGATVGKTYMYREEDGKAIYAGYLIRFIPDAEKVLPEYIFSFTHSAYYKAFVRASAQAVAQPNINAQQYGGLKVCLPPLHEQRLFANKVIKLENERKAITASINEVRNLLNSRMDHCFND
jgi:type I restriction enzyme S subunit